MPPGVFDHRGQAMNVTQIETGLQSVVPGNGRRLELIDIEKRAARGRKWSIVKRSRRGHPGIRRLVDVAIAEELRTVRTDVTNFQHAVLKQLALHVQIVVLDIRRAQIAIDCKNVRVGIAGKEGYAILYLRHGRERKQDRRGANGIVGWPGIERVERQLAHEEVLRKRVVEESPAGAHYSLAFATDVPGRAQTRREIIPVAVVELATAALQHQALRAIEIAETLALFVNHSEVVPAQPQVESDPWPAAPSVLDERPMRVLKGAAACRASPAQVSPQMSVEGAEVQPPPIAGIKKGVDKRAAKLVTKLQIMTRQLPGKIVERLIVRIHPSAGHRKG